MKSNLAEPITINGHMVILSEREYKLLLREAGHAPTPQLDKRIAQARRRYRQKKYLSWDKVKHGLV